MENDELHHEGLSELSVHGAEQGDAHNESVRQSGDWEKSDEPIQAAFEENSPNWEQNKDQNFRQSVSQYELRVHLVRIVLSYEVKWQNGDRENGDESVDAGALLRGEDSPPFDGPVCN